MKKFLKDNVLIFIYLGIVCVIELLGVLVTSDKFYIRSPWIFFAIQLFFVAILFCINSNRVRHIVASIFMIFFAIMNLVFIVIFEMTETMFDYGMLNLKNDAMSILESVPINFLFFTCSILMISIFIVFGDRYVRHNNVKLSYKYIKIIAPVSLALVLILNSLALYLDNKDFKKDIYEKLYKSNESSYAQKGITANFVTEMFKGAFYSDVKLGDEEQLEEFIYRDVYNSNFSSNKTKYNLVTVLVESFEWTSFIQDFELFVNGYNLINLETNQPYSDRQANELLSKLYPNIYDFYKSSIDLTNFYSREKTDISENLSILGAYPTDAYINYDFPKNTMSSSLPNIVKNIYGDENVTCKAFHNGTLNFYNRSEELVSIGFEKFYGDENMYDMGMPNYYGKGERNLDADMIDVCADLMFPVDKSFYTHITTITMHGQYTYRENIASRGYYDEFAEYGINPKDSSDFDAFNYNNFYYYCACVKEFDRALGKIMTELEDRNLKDNTIILLFGDHNTYYSSLSNYVKGLDDTKDENYTNLFRVPCMIHYPNIDEIIDFINVNKSDKVGSYYTINEYENSKGENVKNIQVKKFACTADMMPTLMDLLGINFYKNLYYGNSVFSDDVSVLYSRAYNVFITDSVYFSSLNNIKYIRESIKDNDPTLKYANLVNYNKEEHLKTVEETARILLEKLDVCNRIFYNDYFAKTNYANSSKKNYEIFIDKFKEIN